MSATTIPQIHPGCGSKFTGFVLIPTTGDRSQRIREPIDTPLQPGSITNRDGTDYRVRLQLGRIN